MSNIIPFPVHKGTRETNPVYIKSIRQVAATACSNWQEDYSMSSRILNLEKTFEVDERTIRRDIATVLGPAGGDAA